MSFGVSFAVSDDGPFVCCVSGEPLGGQEDFVVVRRPAMGPRGALYDVYSRKGFLTVYADAVDAATLQPLKEHDHFVTALGGLKFKTENFRCAHSGAELFGVQFFERGGRAYSEAAYLELFHSCPGCLEPVALDDPDKVGALGAVWHAKHLVCVGCREDNNTVDMLVEALDDPVALALAAASRGATSSLLGQRCFAHDSADGNGFQPYCEECYRTRFCPTCGGCGDHINPALEDVLEAAGQCWHLDHFR